MGRTTKEEPLPTERRMEKRGIDLPFLNYDLHINDRYKEGLRWNMR